MPDTMKSLASDIASELGLMHKIDWDLGTDDESYKKWHDVLTKYKAFPETLSLRNLATPVRDIDPSNFRFDSMRDMLHEDFEFAEGFGAVETRVLESRVLQNDIKTTAFVIDVDYEYVNGLKVFLYTRDAGSDTTNLVLCPYHDYFYVKVTDRVTEQDIRKWINGYTWYLREVKFNEEKGYKPRDRKSIPPVTKHDRLVIDMETIEDHRSLYGFQEHCGKFVKVTTCYPDVTKALYNGLSRKHPDMEFFEVSTDVVNKFLTAHSISGCVAVDIVGSQFTNVYSTCDNAIEASSVTLHEGSAHYYSPRTFFYDIECLAIDADVFPTADLCPVIQISYLLMNGDTEEGRGVLCFKETPGYESFEFEEQLLVRFAQIINEFNPDALSGFNSNNFDMPYIIDRMKVLGIHDFASQFSRRIGFKVDYTRSMRSSNQMGTKEVISYVLPGRIMFDQFEVIKGDVTKKLRSYSLKSICSAYLGDDNKEDLKYKEIPVLFKTPEGRARIASYCLQDTLLLHKLDQKMMLGTTAWGMTKVLGVTPHVTLNRGLVFKLMCKLKQYTERFNFLIPTFTDSQKPKFDGKYQGAFVLDPDIGYYEDPVAVLDFASLYPALMIGWNLSYDTIVFDKEWMAQNPDKYEMHCGVPFVKHSVRKGIVPLLEEEMAKQRKLAKKKMKAAPKGSVEAAIYDSEQLANKVIMNSLYGMLGSPTATVPCVEIAKTITGLGRENLLAAKVYVEKNYCEITGEKQPAKVIYGDSVLGDTPVIIKYGEEMSVLNVRDITTTFGAGDWVPVKDSDKESMELVQGVYTWTDSGWTRMYRCIRHLCAKDMVTVHTHTAVVTCTVDHSLLTESGAPIRPTDVVVGETALLHRPVQPEYVLMKKQITYKIGSNTVLLTPGLARVMGYFMGEGYCGTPELDGYSGWFIHSANAKLLDTYMRLLSNCFLWVEFRIVDARNTRGVYRLTLVSGAVADFVQWWRDMCYYRNGEKKIHSTIFSASDVIKQAYESGLRDAGSTNFGGKRISSAMSTLLYMNGAVGVAVNHNTPGVYNVRRAATKASNVVKDIVPYMHHGYVYDFTTDNHHFQAGVGPMIVHNTDSIFIKMPGVTVAKAIEHGQALDKKIQHDIFQHRAPMCMEYEKVYAPFLITRRKGYVGDKFEMDPTQSSVSAMGYQLVRRDCAQLCADTMKEYFDLVFAKHDKEAALKVVEKTMELILSEQLGVENFVITKKIAKSDAEYKTVPPHVLSWRRMVNRVGKTEAPSVGERFEFVVCKTATKGMGDAIVDLELVKEKGFDNIEIDKTYYIKTFIDKPLRSIMELVHGTKQTTKVLNANSYMRKDTVTATKRNILGFFGVNKLVTNKRRKLN